MDFKKVAIFACGALASTLGVQIFTSKTAKKVYTHATAGVLYEKDKILEKVNTLKENCDDIVEEAKAINEKREAETTEEVIGG